MDNQPQASPTLAKAKPPTHEPKYKRLTHDQQIAILKLSKLGKTQAEIGQVLGCNQSSVGRWLEACEDSTGEASAFFRGQALPMAQKIAKRGRPSDLIKALQGVGVLQEERSSGLIVQIGIKDSDVQISLSPGEGQMLERRSAETLTISAGSDKVG